MSASGSKNDVSHDEPHIFARLVALNVNAEMALTIPGPTRSTHHQAFIGSYGAEEVPCFILSLNKLGMKPGQGWRIGSGKPGQDYHGVDFLLRAFESNGVHAVHAYFGWRRGLDHFWLSRMPTALSKNTSKALIRLNGDEIGVGGHRIIPERNSIDIGGCQFRLVYNTTRSAQEQEAFARSLHEHHQTHLRDEHPLIADSPSRMDVWIGPWLVHRPIWIGENKIIEQQVTHETRGTVCMIRTIHRSAKNGMQYDRDLGMYKILQHLPHAYVATPEDISESNTLTEINRDRIKGLIDVNWQPNVMEITSLSHIILPLLTTTLVEVIDTMTTPTRLDHKMYLPRDILAQILEGLAHLHSHRIAHTDLSSGSVGVTSVDPLRLKITDLELSRQGDVFAYSERERERHLAPEMTPGNGYNASVDVWGCGLIGYEMIFKEPYRRFRHPADVDAAQVRLHTSEAPVAAFVARLLQYDRAARPTAAEALTFFQRRHEPPQAAKRARSAEQEEDGEGRRSETSNEGAGNQAHEQLPRDSGYQTAQADRSKVGSPNVSYQEVHAPGSDSVISVR